MNQRKFLGLGKLVNWAEKTVRKVMVCKKRSADYSK